MNRTRWYPLCPPWWARYPDEVVALREAPCASVCVDDECSLSYGDAHAGACEPCDCGEEHAAVECAAFQAAWKRLGLLR